MQDQACGRIISYTICICLRTVADLIHYMKNTHKTPETDAFKRKVEREEYNCIAGTNDAWCWFARKLERERDEARECANEWREHCLKRHTMSQIVSSKLPWEE